MTKTCGRCGTGRHAQATFYDGMDRWCALAAAREAMQTGEPVPTEWLHAVFDTLDTERHNAVENDRWAARELREAADDARWKIEMAREVRW